MVSLDPPDVILLETAKLPVTCNLFTPSSTPVPISTLPPYCANLTSPVLVTSILGIPDISFAEKIVPVNELFIDNNCPLLASKLTVPLLIGYAVTVIF